MNTAAQIVEATEVFRSELDSHPECRKDFCDEAVFSGTKRRHAAFYLGRFLDIDQGEGKPVPPITPNSPEHRLLDYLRGAADPLKMLNPIAPVRHLGKGTGTLAASFGIWLNPELGFTPQGRRPLAELVREGIPNPQTSGIFPQMREDIEATKAFTPPWLKIALPDMQGPFNIAHMVLGDQAFVAPIAEPDTWNEFMRILSEFFILAHRTLTRWIGPERLYSYPGSFHRIAECSVNMVSKDFYLKYVLEHDLRVVDYYGEVAVHPCSGRHVFHVTLEHLPNLIYTEAGHMIKQMTAGSTEVDEALAAIGGRPIVLGIGEELPEGNEEPVMCRLFDLAAYNPRLTFEFTGVGWKKQDDPDIRDLHRRMNEYYAEVVDA